MREEAEHVKAAISLGILISLSFVQVSCSFAAAGFSDTPAPILGFDSGDRGGFALYRPHPASLILRPVDGTFYSRCL
jgi:hypothetical protein